MFFRKKKTKKAIPLDEIQAMQRDGLSDRDIIRELKSKGYAYDEIEAAMLRSVKQGVSQDTQKKEPIVAEPQRGSLESSFTQTFQEETPTQDVFSETEMPEMNEADAKDISPEIIVEELVEGVVEEKWQKIKEQMDKLEEDFNTLKSEVKNAKPAEEIKTPVEDSRVNDVINQMEDLEARVGGLEKAFKQFLPSLTRNIESLSSMIHEMKNRQA